MSELNKRDIWEVANQLEGYVGPDTEERLAAFLMREGGEAAKLAERIVELEKELNTRAVPDVPELVRYGSITNECDVWIEPDDNGEYVLYSQAAEIIAAKDKEIESLKLRHTDEMNDFVLMGMARDEFKNRAEAAEAKLAAMEESK